MKKHPSGLMHALLAVAALLAATAGQVALAQGSSQGTLLVSATVPRHASIRLAQPTELTISEADIARGYVDVTAPVEVRVQSNVPEGYTLAFGCDCAQVRQAVVQGLQGALTVGSSGALSARPAAGHGLWRETLQLRFRFELAAHAQPGQHAWPIDISMMSL